MRINTVWCLQVTSLPKLTKGVIKLKALTNYGNVSFSSIVSTLFSCFHVFLFFPYHRTKNEVYTFSHGFAHIYKINLSWKSSFFVQCIRINLCPKPILIVITCWIFIKTFEEVDNILEKKYCHQLLTWIILS